MSGKFNISSLFDVSGNLTINAMERFLRDELSPEERSLVEEHLSVSEFDREALEGLKKLAVDGLRQEMKDMNNDILHAARKRAKTGDSRISRRTYWYAAAGLAILTGLSVLMFFMFRSPVEKPQLAIAQPDTIINSPASAAGLKENSRIIEKENIPVTDQKKEMASTINPSPQRSSGIEKITPEPNQPVTHLEVADNSQSDIINDDVSVIVEANEVTEFQIVGGIAISDANKMAEENMNSKGERVSTNYEIKANSANTELSEAISKQQSDNEIFMVVEKMPEFPGGEKALNRFLNDSLQYPDAARESGIQGTVYLSFIVNKDGSVTNARVLRGIGGGCDEEAIRVVKSMPNWLPGKQRGKPVRVQFNLPVKFSLE
jgi:TonB family protein